MLEHLGSFMLIVFTGIQAGFAAMIWYFLREKFRTIEDLASRVYILDRRVYAMEVRDQRTPNPNTHTPWPAP